MKRRHWAHIVAAAVVAAAFAAAAPAAAGTPAGSGQAAAGEVAAGPEAAATAYLEARAAAVTAADPAAALAAWVVPGSALARTEAQVAAGTALYGRGGRSLESASCRVTVVDTRPADDGGVRGGGRTRGHAAHLALRKGSHGRRRQRRRPHAHARPRRETAGSSRQTPTTTSSRRPVWRRPERRAPGCAPRRGPWSGPARHWPFPRAAASKREIPRRYTDIIKYDRPAAQAYADSYALSYNPTFVSFAGADCANFASQCARAGDMPQSRGTPSSGWWYDKAGTSTPWDDTYCLSWINCTRQIALLEHASHRLGDLGRGAEPRRLHLLRLER